MIATKATFMHSLFQPYRVEDLTGVDIPNYFMIRWNGSNALYPHVTVPYTAVAGQPGVVRISEFHITFSSSERVYFVQRVYGKWEYGPECAVNRFDEAKPIATTFNEKYLKAGTAEKSEVDFTLKGVYGDSWRA